MGFDQCVIWQLWREVGPQQTNTTAYLLKHLGAEELVQASLTNISEFSIP